MTVETSKRKFWEFVEREAPRLLLAHGGKLSKERAHHWFEQNYTDTLPGDISNAYGHAFKSLNIRGITESAQHVDAYTLTEDYLAKHKNDAPAARVTVPSDAVAQASVPINAGERYSLEAILDEGCFLPRRDIERLLSRLKSKKNLVLQGPPGTGKTWLGRRLGFALIGYKNPKKLRAVQFHPNLSYEDFVRGWRPTSDGQLAITEGVFMEAIDAALAEPEEPFVVLIEEINRGNPAQIFGELLTLLEAGKRNSAEALELSYPDAEGVRTPVHIPSNLYVIGTMNIADRSLALVDLALRRRFAFAELKPSLNEMWRGWIVENGNVDHALAYEIQQRIEALNGQIAADSRLGEQFRIGHSFVTPNQPLADGETRQWFRDVVETEILPQLSEYWFDDPDAVGDARKRLLEGW